MIKNDMLGHVVECIAATTRYPEHLLVADSDLERDLGIDSVKRVEIVVALGERFGLDLQSEAPDPNVRTIGDIAIWVGAKLNGINHERRDTPSNDATPSSDATLSAGPQDGSAEEHASRHSIHAAEQVRPPHHHLPNSVESDTRRGNESEERVVFVTGSGRGIGRSIARAFGARGDTVIVNSFHSRADGEQTVADIQKHGGKAIHLWGSIANPDHVASMFDDIQARFGYLDVLICNASDGRIGPFLELEFDDWDRAFRTNVSGHFQCAVRAARLMKRVGGGSIITMSAVGAHHYVDGLGSQGVVKAAVESLTKYLAGELATFGVRANCVVAGPVYGELISKFQDSQEAQRFWESLSPDRELSNSVDIVNIIEFLTSEKGRGVNGAIWTVDHGFSSQLSSQSLAKSPNHIELSKV